MKLAATLTFLIVLGLGGQIAQAKETVTAPTMADAVKAFDGGDYATAIGIWRALAAKGNDRAMVVLGGLNRSGEGISVNPAKARHWYRRAAIAGNAEGMLSYGHMLMQGHGGAMDTRAAYCWLLRAGQKGKSWARELTARLKQDMPKIPQAGECRDVRARSGLKRPKS